MPLPDGTRLGPYEILAPAGAGGMGEVYKARDTRLNRTVAIKILPSHLTSRDDLRQRFEREARAASSLNHPHICTLHDIGAQDEIDFLVMEWLEGETLEARLRKGPLPQAQFFQVAIQVAEALDQAHQRGLIHRDLKPANIMLTKSGAKLLDFGLAKSKEAPFAAAASSETSAPTMTRALTQEGTVVGTFQYMAPEQLEGSEADARTDIFSFGSVLYEMASGRKAFNGRSHATLISAIMTSEPPPITSPGAGGEALSPAIDHLVRRCLAKEPGDRWQNVHDLLLELKWASQGSGAAMPAASAAPGRKPNKLAWVVAGAVAIAALGEGVALWLRPAPSPPPLVRFELTLPPKVTFSQYAAPVDTIAISPDGRRIAYTASYQGQKLLFYRPLDSLSAQTLPGTEGAYVPFWSPDSRHIAFSADHLLKKIDVAGGTPQVICDIGLQQTSGTWGTDGSILFVGPHSRIHRVPASGGQPAPALELDAQRQETGQLWPLWLPDGRHFIYSSVSGADRSGAFYLAEIGSAKRTLLLNGTRRLAFVQPGWLYFERQSSLMAQAFDVGKAELRGEPALVEGLGADPPTLGGSRFSISENGNLILVNNVSSDAQVTIVSPEGRPVKMAGELGLLPNMSLSPDNKRVAIQRTVSGRSEIWLIELSSGVASRLTFGDYTATDPIWTPDSKSVLYDVTVSGGYSIRRKAIGGGPEEILLTRDRQIFPQDTLKDGTIVALDLGGRTFFRVPPGAKQPEPIFESPFGKDEPHVSPDGKWIAFNSLESGRWEVHVAAFPSFTEKRQISSGGGCQPLWRKDGKELYYLTLDGSMVAVDVKAAADLETGPPRTLFKTNIRVAPTYDQYRVMADGRFILVQPSEQSSQAVTVVLNTTPPRR